jgi:hypothetical protein
MKLFLLGEHQALVWVRDFLEKLFTETPMATMPRIIIAEGTTARELLVSAVGEPISALVLVNHTPFAAGPPADLLPVEAVRHEAPRAIMALEMARHAERVLVLAQADARQWPALLTKLIAELQVDEPLSKWLHGLVSRPWLPPSCPGDVSSALPSTPLTNSYLAPLFAAAAHGAPLTLSWPRESFLDGDTPGTALPATVEVAGRARILAYGPYLPLPCGYWHATAFLGFSPDIGKLPFILEADTGEKTTRGFFEVERGGIFSLELDFQVTDASHSVELRLISQDSALEGQLALIEVELKQSVNP